MLLLIDTEEELEFELPDQTGDGKPGRFFYSRMPHDDLRALTLKVCGAEWDERRWTAAQVDERDRVCILAGWQRGENWMTRKKGGVLAEVFPTAEKICTMVPFAIRHTIARAIRGEIYWQSKEQTETAPPAKVDPLGNSAAT